MNRHFLLLTLGLIFGLTLLNFHPVLWSDYSLDDSYYLSQVEDINGISDLSKVRNMLFSEVDYRPMSTLSFAIEKLLVGEMRPGLSHGINLLLYIVGAWLFSWLVLRLPLATTGKTTALLAGILFTVLPLHCSMVANVKNRDGLLSFLFGMLFLHSLFSLFSPKGKTFQKALWLMTALTCLLLSIYSKLDAFTFVMIIPAATILHFHSIQWKNLARILLITLLSYRFFQFLFALWLGQVTEVMPEESIGDPLMFTENPIVQHDEIGTHLAFAIQTVFEYMRLVFAPSGHYFYFGFDMLPVRPLSSPIIWLKTLAILIPAVLSALYLRRQPMIAVGMVMFYIGLIYCSNLITPVAGIIADRYAFIASAGACIAAAAALPLLSARLLGLFSIEVLENISAPKTTKNSAAPSLFRRHKGAVNYLILGLICVVYLPFNVVRSAEWKDIFSLADADLQHIGTRSYEANRIAVKNYVEAAFELQDEASRRNYLKKAVGYGNQAIQIYDGHMLVQEGMVMAHYGLGQWDEATAIARKVIEKFDTSEVSWRIMAEYYYMKEQLDSAALGFRRLTQLVPESPEVWLYYVTTLQQNGEYEKALAFTDSIPARNDLPPYLPEQARVYLYLNYQDSARAVAEIEKAFEKGWRDMPILDIAGRYWWTRDMAKWEELKKYAGQGN